MNWLYKIQYHSLNRNLRSYRLIRIKYENTETWYTRLLNSFVNSDKSAVFVNNVNWKTEIFVAF